VRGRKGEGEKGRGGERERGRKGEIGQIFTENLYKIK
jgi:hypothetical protein